MPTSGGIRALTGVVGAHLIVVTAPNTLMALARGRQRIRKGKRLDVGSTPTGGNESNHDNA